MNNNRTVGIIATVATSLLCGCPGLGLCAFALMGLAGTQMPEVVAESGADPQNAMLGALMFICVSIFLIAIPVVTGILTLRKKPEADYLPPSEPLPPA